MSESNPTNAAMVENARPDLPSASVLGGVERELSSVERSALTDLAHAATEFHNVINRIEASAIKSDRASGSELEVARTKIMEACAWARRHILP